VVVYLDDGIGDSPKWDSVLEPLPDEESVCGFFEMCLEDQWCLNIGSW